jgi:hypothetical protein
MSLLLLLLLLLLLIPVAAEAAPADDDVQAARAKTCAAFLSEMSRHTAGGGAPGQTPSFALVWGALLKDYQAKTGSLTRIGMGRRMFDATVGKCQHARALPLGTVMDAEFANLP